ncbi:MAG: hypothetical protein AAF572_12705 [Cyanobacteria bacterium P01_B01_bin.77]
MSELTGTQYFNEQRTMHECPQCGKHSLVQTTSTKFECIWCDFHRDLNAKPQKSKSNVFLSAIVLFGIIGLGLFGIASLFSIFLGPKVFSSQPRLTTVPDTAPDSDVKIEPEQLPEISITENTIRSNSEISNGYPKAACGYDMAQVEQGVSTVELYPIFVNYSPAILEKVQTQYCQDAFRNNQNNLIQVASFRSQDRANEFRALLEKEFGDAQVGAARTIAVR